MALLPGSSLWLALDFLHTFRRPLLGRTLGFSLLAHLLLALIDGFLLSPALHFLGRLLTALIRTLPHHGLLPHNFGLALDTLRLARLRLRARPFHPCLLLCTPRLGRVPAALSLLRLLGLLELAFALDLLFARRLSPRTALRRRLLPVLINRLLPGLRSGLLTPCPCHFFASPRGPRFSLGTLGRLALYPLPLRWLCCGILRSLGRTYRTDRFTWLHPLSFGLSCGGTIGRHFPGPGRQHRRGPTLDRHAFWLPRDSLTTIPGCTRALTVFGTTHGTTGPFGIPANNSPWLRSCGFTRACFRLPRGLANHWIGKFFRIGAPFPRALAALRSTRIGPRLDDSHSRLPGPSCPAILASGLRLDGCYRRGCIDVRLGGHHF